MRKTSTKAVVFWVAFTLGAVAVVGRGAFEYQRLLRSVGGDQAMALRKASPIIGLFLICFLLVVLVRLGMAGQAKRARGRMLEQGGHAGVLIAEADKSLTQGLRSAYPELRSGSTREIVPWRFLLTWNEAGIQFWTIVGKPSELLAELPWEQMSLSVSRIHLERSTRIALDIQLLDGPIHIQMALRHDRRGLPYYSIDELTTLVAELEAVANRTAEPAD
ncbi:hypothetical protein SAMN06295879_2036 [Agreia bicolorata]|uniref:PH domain-containing protein n=1 Tax=Agreia bicolorata TaxID=110935 RepID=A0A1T4Y1B9_9MICO|nr:hypothetical protein [Agreia bicolorata]SKA95592.1 hypothetical protein SAMN06295879_2036 [Agreia bicolorata]